MCIWKSNEPPPRLKASELIDQLSTDSPARENELFSWALEACEEMTCWYRGRAKRFGRWASGLRWSAILGLAATLLWLPLLSTLGAESFGTWLGIPAERVPHLGYLVGAFTAALVFMDRVGGHSKAWIRYSRTCMALEGLLSQTVVKYAGTAGSTPEDVNAQYALILKMLEQMWKLVEDETAQWARDYSDDLSSLHAELSKEHEDKK